MDNPYSICKNCEHSFHGNYCSQCGQVVFKRFTISYFWNLLHQDLFEIDRGLWRTFKDLVTRPGYMVKDFLNGKIKLYFSPLKYLLAAIALFYLLVSAESFLDTNQSNPMFWEWKREYFYNDHPAFSFETLSDLTYIFPVVISKGLTVYFLFFIPFLALGSLIVFKRYNFTEYLITFTFMWGHVVMLLALAIPLIYVGELLGASNLVSTLLLGLLSVSTFYSWILMFKQLHGLSWIKSFFKFVLVFYGSMLPFYAILILSFMALKVILV